MIRARDAVAALWSHAEGRGSAYPLALFRLCFYTGVLLHFGPSLWNFEESYGPTATLKSSLPVAWLRAWLDLPLPVAWSLSFVPALAALAGLFGGPPRICAGLAGLGFYWLSCVNSLHTSTLALPLAWMIFGVFTLFGGGNEVLTILPRAAAREAHDRFASVAIAVHLCAVVFLAGLEKLRAGWWHENEMAVLLRYPAGIVLRGPFAGLHGALAEALGWALTVFTLIVELGAPLLLLWQKTRPLGVTLFLVLFAGIGVTMQVPPLFVLLYAGLPVLLVAEDRVELAVSSVRCWGRSSLLRLGQLGLLLACAIACSRSRTRLPDDGARQHADAERAKFGIAGAPGCAPSFPGRCDPRQTTCQDAMFAHVACLTRTTGDMRRPPVRVVSAAELTQHQVSRASPATLEVELLRRAALRLLGLAAEVEAPGAPAASSGSAGFYSFDTREVVLSETGGDALVLLHEYVHALQDRDGRIGLALSASATLDEQLATRASLEGEATLYELEARARSRTPPESVTSESLAARARVGSWLAARSGSVLDSAASSFVYAHGAAYAALHRPSTLALVEVERHLEQKRAGTLGILAGIAGWPSRPVADVGPGPRRLQAAELRLSERIGAWMVEMLLSHSSPTKEQSSEVAQAYRGDWLGYYTSTRASGAEKPQTLVLLEVRWSSEARAAEAKLTLEGAFDDRERFQVLLLPDATTVLMGSGAPIPAAELARHAETIRRHALRDG